MSKQTAVQSLKLKVMQMINNGGCEDLLAVIVHIDEAIKLEKKQMCRFAFDYNDEYLNNGKAPSVHEYYKEMYGGYQ
jgi:hypothetical protein